MAHEITTNQEQLATKRKAAIHAMDLLPSVVPSALESERLIGIITEQTITSLKNRYLDIARTSETQQGSDIVTRTITQLGGRQKLIEESLSGKTASIDTPAKPDMFRTTLWDLLVSEEFGRIDREALSQRRDQDGKTIHENHIHAASEAIAKARIIQERADSFSQADIAQQLLAAQKHGSKVTEAELRLNRARKELGGIDPEKHPQEHERLTQTARAIEARLIAGEKEGFSDAEQRIIAKELGGINAITRGIAQEALTQEVSRVVQKAVHSQPKLLQQAHWEETLSAITLSLAALPEQQRQSALDEHIAHLMRQSGALNSDNKLSKAERAWVLRISDAHLARELSREGLGKNGIPLTYTMLHNDLHRENVLASDMPTLVEINRRLSQPNLRAIMVLCPDYARDYQGDQVIYRFDGLSKGLGLVGEVGMPVILPVAERVGRIHAATGEKGDIPTFRLAYADIEATEGNIKSTGIGNKEAFLSHLDGSINTLAQTIERYFKGKQVHIVTEETAGELMKEKTVLVLTPEGQPMVRFSLGALTNSFTTKGGEKPSHQFERRVGELRQQGVALLEKSTPGFLGDIDEALIGRLPIALKLQWNQTQSLPGAKAVEEIATLHNALSEGNFRRQISPRDVSRGLSELVGVVNELVTKRAGTLSQIELNKAILDWLKANMPDALKIIRTRHVIQLAEYVTVGKLIEETYAPHALQIVGDTIILNQKAARGSKTPRLYIKGRNQYSGSLSQEELAAVR